MSQHNGLSVAERDLAYELIYAGCEADPGKYTNDLPIAAEVWLAYREHGFDQPRQLLLTPHAASSAARLRKAAVETLPELQRRHGVVDDADLDRVSYVAASESHVLANIDFRQLVTLMPLASWWAARITEPLRQRRRRSNGARILDELTSASFTAWVAGEVARHLAKPQLLRRLKSIGVAAMSRADVGQGCEADEQAAVRRLVNLATLYVALEAMRHGDEGDEGDDGDAARRQAFIDERTEDALRVLVDCVNQRPARDERNHGAGGDPPLWSVSLNRAASHTVFASRKTVKADAAIRVFELGGQDVRWAVVDSGIDARHPAFARHDRVTEASQLHDDQIDPALSRVVRTLDFTRFAALASGRVPRSLADKLAGRMTESELDDWLLELAQDVADGHMLDWDRLEPLLEIPHEAARYEPPHDSHGTHVAGILGANWTRRFYARLHVKAGRGRRHPAGGLVPPTELAEGDVCGVCPFVELIDLRVFKPREVDGEPETVSDEFAITAALQYVRHLNQGKDKQHVHGINMSLSLRHEVRNYACGSTPVCLEAERTVASGVVVVAAAGNYGYDKAYAEGHLGGAYRGQSITDPGNSPSVITVGATHRSNPYQFGVSYFSSHGPTGDGRNKPDIVAPGEKITSTIPDAKVASKDGTSMAAPHVSGVAALLLSRNAELMGQPQRVKEILCRSASDLGRDKVFQGAGLVDALRALQSV